MKRTGSKQDTKSKDKGWKDIRTHLNNKYELNSETEEYWKLAVEIFRERLQNYYFDPLKFLIDSYKKFEFDESATDESVCDELASDKPATEKTKKAGKKKNIGEGFPILTAQCALIETFAAYKKGKIFKSDLKEEDGIYYKGSRKLFIDFLESETLFKGNFGGDSKPSAEDFYSDVRCGLMHETRTKNNWIIHANVNNTSSINSSRKKEITETTFILKGNSGKHIVFRNQLQCVLEKYFEYYSDILSSSDNSFHNLSRRRFFARKLDHLYLDTKEIKEDKSDWWNE